MKFPSLNKTQKPKPWFIIGIIALITLLLGITGYFAYQNYKLKHQATIVLPQPNPETVTSSPATNSIKPTNDTTTCAYRTINTENFKNIDTYIKNNVCQNNYPSWETATSSGLFQLKHPSYFKQNLDYGADSFEIEHPNLGKFEITTFTHDYYGKTNSFSEKVCTLAEIGHISKDTSEYAYYKDSLEKYYIVGINKAIILEDKTPNMWGISISDIQNEDPKTNNEEQLAKTEDFKCFIRSIELLD